MKNGDQKIQLFRSLFKGRDDTFAIRWEKNSKSGYMPAYFIDPYRFRVHKINGGTFQNFTEKSLLPLTDDQIAKHLKGEQFIGIYPLLTDNKSWFITADFDEEDWAKDAVKFIKCCNERQIPAYLEVSRSGNGGHVWVFFDKPYEAYKSRKVILQILLSSGIVSLFDKDVSFDRLFPNQDYLTGKGFGNLIALPFNLLSLNGGTNCFVDPDTLIPYPHQWAFLAEVKRTVTNHLDNLYVKYADSNSSLNYSETLHISLNNKITITRPFHNPKLILFLRETLNISNKDYFIKRNSGKNTFGTKRHFSAITEGRHEISIPKGFIGKLLRFCVENNITYNFTDQRKLLHPVPFRFEGTLRDYQRNAMTAINAKHMGVIVAPPGAGKTIVALKIVAEKSQPTLIIVHRQQLVAQWIERIESFLGIPSSQIGRITAGRHKPGCNITVATIQSLSKMDLSEQGSSFGLIIVDECHHIPAETFSATINKFNSYYLFGLTATPFRKQSDGELIFIHMGEVIAEIKPDFVSSLPPQVIIRNTSLDIPFNPKTDRFETISKILVHDSQRNMLILNDIVHELSRGQKAIILTERKEHIDTLNQYLKQSFETITLSGDDNTSSKAAKWNDLKEGRYQALITTSQLFGEGSDLQNAHCLFLVYPFSFEGKLIQYIGRVQRSEKPPTIYDYRDIKIDYLNRMFLKRNIYYKKLIRQTTLFDAPNDSEPKPLQPSDKIITKTIQIKINDLGFFYGCFQLQYHLTELNETLTFDIENLYIRPEFEVLKAYFSKFLKSSIVSVDLTIITNNNKEVEAQEARSADLDKLNREVVDGLRFRFVEKSVLGKRVSEAINENILNTSHLAATSSYDSGEQLLADILSSAKYKHHKQLEYLAERHEGQTLKLRFVLSPFAFVFLLAGIENYHIVMETLDTTEATYVWHLEKSLPALKTAVTEIESQLGRIRTDGRQVFIDTAPSNFRRILHDYSDERKGFIIWRDNLEENLY